MRSFKKSRAVQVISNNDSDSDDADTVSIVQKRPVRIGVKRTEDEDDGDGALKLRLNTVKPQINIKDDSKDDSENFASSYDLRRLIEEQHANNERTRAAMHLPVSNFLPAEVDKEEISSEHNHHNVSINEPNIDRLKIAAQDEKSTKQPPWRQKRPLNSFNASLMASIPISQSSTIPVEEHNLDGELGSTNDYLKLLKEEKKQLKQERKDEEEDIYMDYQEVDENLVSDASMPDEEFEAEQLRRHNIRLQRPATEDFGAKLLAELEQELATISLSIESLDREQSVIAQEEKSANKQLEALVDKLETLQT